MPVLVLLRHGESVWNRDNRFTGWTDVALSERGLQEAVEAGQTLQSEGFAFEVAYTSLLKRAIKTLWLVLEELDQMWIPVHRSWRMNERHYGALQGLEKAETARREGIEQVARWRRGYRVRPPALGDDDERHPVRDRRYADVSSSELPSSESLADTERRILPYWHDAIATALRQGRRVLVCAHGNSLRALVKHLEGIPDDEIPNLDIPMGIPRVYELDATLRPLRHRYLADAQRVREAERSIAAAANPEPRAGGRSRLQRSRSRR